MQNTSGALSGIRVLDLTRVVAGPWATQLMADMGAEVIKVERPGSGDDCRTFGPPFLHSRNGSAAQSVYFLGINRGKQSVTIDFEKPEGRELIRELADKSDVLIENYKVGSLDKLGLGYEALSKRHPGLIYCSITGFGQTGPFRNRPGYDLIAQAMGGLMSVTGHADGDPMKSGIPIADILTALYAAIAILAALHERHRSNRGQQIDLALFDVQVASLANQAGSYLATGKVPRRHGNEHANLAPYQSFPTSDGYIVIAVANDTQFARLAAVLDLKHLANDPRFLTNSARVQNRQDLIPLLSQRLQQKNALEWLTLLDRADIPAGPINSMNEVFSSPQIKERELIVEFPAGNHDPIRVVGNPIHFSRTPVSYPIAPPELGAQTKQVLERVLHKNPEAIEILRKKEVI